MTEEYFPRGGKKPNVTYFKQSSNFLGAAEKGQGKKKKQKKKSENDDGYLSDEAVKEVDQSYKMCAAGIGQKTIKPGVTILGRVRRALDTKLLVSLPSKLEGTVMACHISQAYNKQLEAYVNDAIEKVRELGDMFRRGQYVALQVLEADASGELMLSAMPQHVNGARTHSDLKKGDILQAAVSSVEDHGYVMDLGVANATAFLAKADANPEIELDTGVLIWTCVKSHTAGADSSLVALSGALPALQKALRRKKGALQPGTAVEFTVDKPLDNGIEGRVVGDTTAYIQRFHADNSKGKKPTLGQKLRAYVLYVMPTRNQPFLTMRDIFKTTYPDLSEEMVFKEGDIIEEAQVLKIACRSIHFKLGRRCVGTMSLTRLAVDEELTDEQVIAKSYPLGSTHRVRVLAYNMSDYVYHVSDQPSVLAERHFSLDQLAAGDRARGAVRSVGDRYITVAIGRLSGVVMQTHLSDAGVYVDPKKATSSNLSKKKYKVGQEVTVRVLSCDPLRQNLLLTMKPSLLAEDIEVLATYDQAEVGKSYTGFIKVVKDYVLVGFFGNVVVYVPANQVCSPPIESLSDSFHPGQIVNCTIMKIDRENKKMAGSLITPPFWPAERPPYLGKRKKESEDIEPSETTKKKRKSNDDVPENTEESGEPKRKSFVKILKTALQEEGSVGLSSYEQAEVGKNYTGFVKVVKDYVLVGFFGNVVVYVPANQVCSPPVESLSDSFHPGQIVNCTIMKIDRENKKMAGSLITPSFWPAERPPYLGKRKKESEDIEPSETTKKKRKSNDDVPENTEESGEPKRQSFVMILKTALQEEGSEGLSSYEQAEVGKNYTGFVKVVKDYVLVGFLNGVVAYVPRYYARDPPHDDLAEALQLGQIVKCTILQCHPDEKKMLGSLTIPPFWPAKKAPLTRKHKNDGDNETPKKKKKNNKVNEVSEESDAIETDIYEDSDHLLTPEDKALIDLSDCETLEEWRKRVKSLGIFIKCRLRRIENLNKKIVSLEEKGLCPENKKSHTAMHQEILVIKERIKKLVEALDTAQKKLIKLEIKEGDVEKHKKEMVELNKLKAKIVKKEEPKKKKKTEDKEETITDEIEAGERRKKPKEKVKKDKEVTVDKSKDIKVVESLEPALEVPSAKDFWSENADDLAKNVQEECSSSSEDEEKEQPKKKRKKLSAAEKDAKARAEEDRLRELERRAADDSHPRSSDQFERALLANPNCSQLWVAYMAFHLQATEIDKARAVARRALGAISFREEGDKLNVWLALLNLEHRFGTKESQQKTLEDALQMNDTFKIHSKLLEILADTSKPQELSTLVDLMLKKYKRDPRSYLLCGQACFKTGLVDKARHVMQKAISVLEKKEHVQILVQFALLERSSGSRERAEALFEQVLAVYPQRVDVGAAYADMLAKAGDVDQLRQVMERMTSHKLPARKMKVLYNKWVELEERAGNTDQAEQVRERALQFIEKAKF